ncbi:hypothetical protein HMI55_004628 [Coelomomyces lativittatus]|nr:hypothetical protein HMI55_004628 [Coelomomyces lativittatus]
MPHLQASATFKKEVCGVGPSYLVISKDMASRWRLRSYPEVLNNRIQCEHCCTELGELSYRGEVQVWKLYKTMLLPQNYLNYIILLHACHQPLNLDNIYIYGFSIGILQSKQVNQLLPKA